jgi:hypothetical protein
MRPTLCGSLLQFPALLSRKHIPLLGFTLERHYDLPPERPAFRFFPRFLFVRLIPAFRMTFSAFLRLLAGITRSLR